MSHPPPRDPPPIRMGNRSDLVRRQKATAEAKHKAEARVRTRIYQDILALQDIAERLTLDLSCHEDRYGIEWNGLARQIYMQYNADVLKIIPGFQGKIMSKEGAHGLPKELYRSLLDFADECASFMKWALGACKGTPAPARPRGPSPAPGPQESEFMRACQRFKKACSEMQHHICIFENERSANEESFFE
jgi:hypothetical protein